MSEISQYIKKRIAEGVSREVIATELSATYGRETYMKHLIDIPDPAALLHSTRQRQAMAGLIVAAALVIAASIIISGGIINALLVLLLYSLVAWYAYTLSGSAAILSLGLIVLMLFERLIYLVRSLLSGYGIVLPVIEIVLLAMAALLLLRLRSRLHPKYTMAMFFDRIGLYDMWRED